MNEMKRILLPLIFFITASLSLTAFEITLTGGARMDIPEAWELDESDPSVPSWYSPDRRSAAEVMLWAPGTWDTMDSFIENARPQGAEGDVFVFQCWDGEAALATWAFPGSGGSFCGWFLFVVRSGPDVRVSAIAAEEDFSERQPFLLSVLDSYIPGENWRLTPGAVSTFLEATGELEKEAIRVPFEDTYLSWEQSSAGSQASQDVIEREALILSAYASVPELFYPAWERYYRLIYRDSYSRLEPLAEALLKGPLPRNTTDPRVASERLLSWLQGFSYGSTDKFSDLLSPSAVCSSQTGDCDSLSLVLLILMDYYGVDGILLLSQQAHHALTGLDVPGEGMRYTEGENSWIVAELTSNLPLGVLPDRLTGVSDWFGITLLSKE